MLAIADVAGPLDDEIPALADILGVRPYDVRLALNGTPPAIVLRTASREVADRALAALRARRCAALAIHQQDVVPAGRMVPIKRFALDDDGLRASESGPKLPWTDVAAIVRVATTATVERTQMESEPRQTGRGQVVEQRERTHFEREHEQLLYLFPPPRSGATPWLLRAREARYLGLGADLRATAHENFLATVAAIRARAPRAIYDERHVLHPLTRHHTVQVRGDRRSTATIADAGVDLPVHLLASWLLEPRNDPYRDERA